MSHTKKGSSQDIIKRIYNNFNGEVSEYEIRKVINMFWGPIGILKYMRGFKSFSVNRMFFFLVNKNKIRNYIEKKRKTDYKRNKAYWKKNRKKLLKKRKKL